MDNIAELNDIIFAGTKLISDRVSIPQKKHNRNTNPAWNIRPEEQIKKLRIQENA